MSIFRGKRPKPPWDYLIEKGNATQEDYDAYEAALNKGDITEAQAIEANVSVGGIKRRKRG